MMLGSAQPCKVKKSWLRGHRTLREEDHYGRKEISLRRWRLSWTLSVQRLRAKEARLTWRERQTEATADTKLLVEEKVRPLCRKAREQGGSRSSTWPSNVEKGHILDDLRRKRRDWTSTCGCYDPPPCFTQCAEDQRDRQDWVMNAGILGNGLKAMGLCLFLFPQSNKWGNQLSGMGADGWAKGSSSTVVSESRSVACFFWDPRVLSTLKNDFLSLAKWKKKFLKLSLKIRFLAFAFERIWRNKCVIWYPKWGKPVIVL